MSLKISEVIEGLKQNDILNEEARMYVAICGWDGGEPDAIVFLNGQECDEFCDEHDEYMSIMTGVHTLETALDIFG